MKKIADGLYETICEINLHKLKNSCNLIYSQIENLPIDSHWFGNDGQKDAPKTTKTNLQYNIFTFVYPQIHNLFKTIQNNFYLCEKDYYSKNLKCNYFLQGWLNVYKKDQFLDWHSHHYNIARGWHGFFCVDAELSSTLYKFENNSIIEVPSTNNKLVLGLCANNYHKTNPWHNVYKNRVTIAFDIIPEIGLKQFSPNHWIPI